MSAPRLVASCAAGLAWMFAMTAAATDRPAFAGAFCAAFMAACRLHYRLGLRGGPS